MPSPTGVVYCDNRDPLRLPAGRGEGARRLGGVVAWSSEQLTAADLYYVATLPAMATITLAAGPSLFCFHR